MTDEEYNEIAQEGVNMTAEEAKRRMDSTASTYGSVFFLVISIFSVLHWIIYCNKKKHSHIPMDTETR